MKFRKKPVTITARRATHPEDIETLEGTMKAAPGDWIVTGVEGEQYPVKDRIFRATYVADDEEARQEFLK